MKKLLLFFTMALTVPLYSMGWHGKITRYFSVAISASEFYKSTQAKYKFNKKFPISIKGKSVAEKTIFESTTLESQVNTDPLLPDIYKGMEKVEKRLCEITQLPIFFKLSQDIVPAPNFLNAEVCTFKDINGNKVVLFTTTPQTLKMIASDHPATEPLLYHEGGHIVLKHGEKLIDMRHKIDLVSFLASLALYFATSHLPLETVKDMRNNMIVFGAQWGLHFAGSALKQYYSRQREWEADEYVIKHCKNPEALEAEAHQFDAIHEYKKTQGTIFKPFFASHPPANQRAELFHKAAKQILREESKQ